jgi:hypothetical protein
MKMKKLLIFLCICHILAACDSKNGNGDGEEADSTEDTLDTMTDMIEDSPVDLAEDTSTDVPSDTVSDVPPDTEEDMVADDGDDGTSDAVVEPRECTPEEAAECDEHAHCTVEDGSAVCTCDDGWTGPGDVCVNIDECSDGTHDCDPNATCTDTPGSFTCECNEYYAGTGTFCYEIDPETFVADVSARPIAIEISGVGTFDIHAMGRLAKEVEYTSVPGTGYHMERIPSGWTVHDLVMRDITAETGSDITDLATWAGTTTSHEGLITLDGLGSELLELHLIGLVPVSADTTITSGSMAEIVVSIDNVDRIQGGSSSYTPPASMSVPGGSTLIEIEGVACNSAFLPPDITEAAAATADPIHLRKIGTYRSPGYGTPRDLIDWMWFATWDLDVMGDITRRSLSEIHLDGSSVETDRVNCFETFPYLIYYFNPAKHYGTCYLIDISIATEFCEAG